MPFGHQSLGLLMVKGTAILLSPGWSFINRDETAFAGEGLSVTFWTRNEASAVPEEMTSITAVICAESLSSWFFTMRQDSMRAVSQASSETGRHTPLVAKRGPQSQPN